MSETIFDQVTPEVVEPQQNAIPTELAEFVGEGKKYQTVEDALKSIPHAQSHIQKLEEEMKQAREELAKRKAAEELLEEFKTQGMPENKAASLDMEALTKVVENALSAKEAQKAAQNNINTVVNAFNSKFGEKGPEQYKQLAQETGVPLEALNKLAATSPQAVFRLAGLEAKSFTPGKTSSSVNTTTMQNQGQALSVKVKPVGTSTKELISAWRNADALVKQELGIKE